MKIEEENVKMEKIVNLLKNSEDGETFFDALYDLYFFIGIAKGVDDMNNGRGITLEELHKEVEARHENYRRRFS